MTMTKWMAFAFTIRGRLTLLALVAVGALAAVGFSGWFGGVQLGWAVEEVGASSEALDQLMVMRQSQLLGNRSNVLFPAMQCKPSGR
jgi:hypothetical protein